MGLCAGGYYDATYIQFSKGNPVLEVCGKRELKLFEGGAIGPLYPGFKSTHSKLDIQSPCGLQESIVLYCGSAVDVGLSNGQWTRH